MVSLLVPPNVATTIDQHISNSNPISFWRERETDRLFKGIMIDHEQLNPLVRWKSLTLLSPHREWKAKVFYTKDGFCIFFYLHRDMQVIPDSKASIVLLLFNKKIIRWSSWRFTFFFRTPWECPEKKSQSIAWGKERLLVIGLDKQPCI